MTPQTCASNIIGTIDFSIKSSKDKTFIRQMKELKEKISYVFEEFTQDLHKIRETIKDFIMKSRLYRDQKTKIEHLLQKMK